MLSSMMNGEPYLVGRFAHTLRMRLMREHLGIDVDEVLEEEQQEEEDRRSEQWEKDMDKFHGKETSDRETKDKLLESKHQKQDEVLQKSEYMSSFNHDVDWEQANNPNLKSGKKLTESPRVTNNPEHKKDVDGGGADAMNREELAGRAGLRDTYLMMGSTGSKEVLVSSEDAKAANGKPSKPEKVETRQRSTPRLTEDGRNSALPPSETLRGTSSSLHGLSQKSTLPPLPVTDDTDIGGPPPQRTPSQNTTESTNPLVADMKRLFVDKDCMRDPLNDSFYIDTWHAIAENNTKLFRQVFRCMPDNEVKSWKDYKEYFAYADRFSHAQGGGKSRDRMQQEAPGSSGPPGQSSVADKLRMLGPIGEKAAEAESEGASLGEKLTHSLGQKDIKEINQDSRLMGSVEEWAEQASKDEAERHARDAKAQCPGSSSVDGVLDEKTAIRSSNELKYSAPVDSENLSKMQSPPSVTYSEALNRNTSTQKRRRRATTRSSRREFHASDDIISPADAEELMHMVQGHLVTWPYDWLAKEEQGGNWLYSIDGLAPLEI